MSAAVAPVVEPLEGAAMPMTYTMPQYTYAMPQPVTYVMSPQPMPVAGGEEGVMLAEGGVPSEYLSAPPTVVYGTAPGEGVLTDYATSYTYLDYDRAYFVEEAPAEVVATTAKSSKKLSKKKKISSRKKVVVEERQCLDRGGAREAANGEHH
eukprot:CAMPEP_0180630900 /NCGR_PEP_ID=MMETSP1037_2-20121125/40241_1 /TAXON_ID=632150 /ORGANISM="Azadinium spinosum, Strain 3D9" /LENGTH=151 /DNA_ID=CAMNT_0022651799 /DNA_START=74 /DNA_END=528 /DNA_ORIENTATION=+